MLRRGMLCFVQTTRILSTPPTAARQAHCAPGPAIINKFNGEAIRSGPSYGNRDPRRRPVGPRLPGPCARLPCKTVGWVISEWRTGLGMNLWKSISISDGLDVWTLDRSQRRISRRIWSQSHERSTEYRRSTAYPYTVHVT
jgi:hypothetical protein